MLRKKSLCTVKRFTSVSSMNVQCMNIFSISIRISNLRMKMKTKHKITLTVNFCVNHKAALKPLLIDLYFNEYTFQYSEPLNYIRIKVLRPAVPAMLQLPFLPAHNYDGPHQSPHARQSLQNVLWLDSPCAWQNQIVDALDPSQSFDDHG